MMLQNIIVMVIVSASVAYLTGSLRSQKRKNKSNCSGCSGDGCNGCIKNDIVKTKQ